MTSFYCAPGRGIDLHGSRARLPSTDAADQKQIKAMEKTLGGKVTKQDFPSQLANPAPCAGFALSHRLYGY